MFAKRVLAIHDLCSYGRCSLTAAIPVLSSMGFQVCPMPLSLSSNTAAHSSSYSSDVSGSTRFFMDKWEEIGCTYQAIYSGYLSNDSQLRIAADAIRRFARPDTLIVIDPILAKSGQLSPALTPALTHSMKRLIKKATVITPNFNEACLLTGKKPELPLPSLSFLTKLCTGLAALGPRYVIVTAVPTLHNSMKIVSYDAATFSYDERQHSLSLNQAYGLSDLFASVLTGALLKKYDLHEAMTAALDFLFYSVTYTQLEGTDLREGVQLEPCLHQLFKI